MVAPERTGPRRLGAVALLTPPHVLACTRRYPAAMTTIGRRAAIGGPPLSPDVTNAASISGHSIPSGLALRRVTMASSRGGAARADEGHVPLRHSTTSIVNQVSSSAATFLVDAEVWRAMSSK